MCLCILYMCTCVGRLSVFLYVCVWYSAPEERERKKGEVGRGYVEMEEWEGESILSSRNICLTKCGEQM